jgi:hypothetical protein
MSSKNKANVINFSIDESALVKSFQESITRLNRESVAKSKKDTKSKKPSRRTI